MADETTDIINKEQFVICIRWVDNDLNKDFIGLQELSVTNAETLAFILKDVVLRLELDHERLRGQCYDGCSTLKSCKLMQNALKTSLEISKLVKKSPKRKSQLITIHTKGLFTENDEQNKTKNY